jgi:hypothetical protein
VGRQDKTERLVKKHFNHGRGAIALRPFFVNRAELLVRNIIQNQIARSLFLPMRCEIGNAEFFSCVLICGCKIHSTSREVRQIDWR